MEQDQKEIPQWRRREGGKSLPGVSGPVRDRAPRPRLRRASQPPPPHLHHQHDGVQGNHGHDGILEGRGHHKVPDPVLERVPVLRHVAGERFGTDGEVDARSLKESHSY